MSQRRLSISSRPSLALIVVLALVALAAWIGLLVRFNPSPALAQAPTAEPTVPVVVPAPTSVPVFLPERSPVSTPVPEPDYTLPISESEAVDQAEWFKDAVFIGDSRVDGLRIFSGITDQCDFLTSTGITVFEIMENRKVLRQGEKKVSILDALAQKEYQKIYIALGVNELGASREEFIGAYRELLEAIRRLQPSAHLYIQSIIPVNTTKCKANGQRSYVTNENVVNFNAGLSELAAEKKVCRLEPGAVMADVEGEVYREFSSDGVHFTTAGYQVWLDFLTRHTGEPTVTSPVVPQGENQ